MKVKIKSERPDTVKQIPAKTSTGLIAKCWEIIVWDIRNKLGFVSTGEIWDHEVYESFLKMAKGGKE